MAVCRAQASILTEKMDEAFYVAYQQCGNRVDHGFPYHVIDERPVGIPVYERELVRDEYNFADHEGAECSGGEG